MNETKPFNLTMFYYLATHLQFLIMLVTDIYIVIEFLCGAHFHDTVLTQFNLRLILTQEFIIFHSISIFSYGIFRYSQKHLLSDL